MFICTDVLSLAYYDWEDGETDTLMNDAMRKVLKISVRSWVIIVF